jgi:hypothetical protein
MDIPLKSVLNFLAVYKLSLYMYFLIPTATTGELSSDA